MSVAVALAWKASSQAAMSTWPPLQARCSAVLPVSLSGADRRMGTREAAWLASTASKAATSPLAAAARSAECTSSGIGSGSGAGAAGTSASAGAGSGAGAGAGIACSGASSGASACAGSASGPSRRAFLALAPLESLPSAATPTALVSVASFLRTALLPFGGKLRSPPGGSAGAPWQRLHSQSGSSSPGDCHASSDSDPRVRRRDGSLPNSPVAARHS